MVNPNLHPYSDGQIIAWLRGLLSIAWADGHFDPEEQELITALTKEELAPQTPIGDLDPIAPEELAIALGDSPQTRENFLRTAVMMAISNGVYSTAEAQLVRAFCEALALEVSALDNLEATLCDLQHYTMESNPEAMENPGPDVLNPVRKWLDNMDVADPRLARFLCKLIPSQCPFERDVTLFGKKIIHIPPMCKINPLYEQLMGLRFRSLSFLADECEEDVTPYL